MFLHLRHTESAVDDVMFEALPSFIIDLYGFCSASPSDDGNWQLVMTVASILLMDHRHARSSWNSKPPVQGAKEEARMMRCTSDESSVVSASLTDKWSLPCPHVLTKRHAFLTDKRLEDAAALPEADRVFIRPAPPPPPVLGPGAVAARLDDAVAVAVVVAERPWVVVPPLRAAAAAPRLAFAAALDLVVAVVAGVFVTLPLAVPAFRRVLPTLLPPLLSVLPPTLDTPPLLFPAVRGGESRVDAAERATAPVS